LFAVAVAVMLSSGCGNLASKGRSPSQLIVISIQTARGTGTVPAAAGFTSGPLLSDVPNVVNNETVFDDFGLVTLSAILKDLGAAGAPSAPTGINRLTITSYRVEYRRSDGRNTPGVDVPLAFTSALTMSVITTADGFATSQGVFELVRHDAKLEPPLAALGGGDRVISMVADVTFFGHDQAGNNVSATGSVQINFANFA
jgi:hypothetical protein